LDLSLLQIAPKKLTSKRARKTTIGEGSSTTPPVEFEFDGHLFEVNKDWSFLKERMVQLVEGEYLEFQTEIARRH